MQEETREHRSFATELKFLVTPDQGDAVRQWARLRLVPDPHGLGADHDRYSTASLYFDTAGHDVFHRRASHGRAKYRVRRYSGSDMVFLERKLRTKTLLSKRRSLVPLTDVSRFHDTPATWPARWPGAWFGQRLQARALAPVCEVSYDRTARLTPSPYGPARLTLDEHVGARPARAMTFHSEPCQPVLTDQVILELKFRVEMPALFLALVETFGLNPDRISKYRLSMMALGLAADGRPGEEMPCPAC